MPTYSSILGVKLKSRVLTTNAIIGICILLLSPETHEAVTEQIQLAQVPGSPQQIAPKFKSVKND